MLSSTRGRWLPPAYSPRRRKKHPSWDVGDEANVPTSSLRMMRLAGRRERHVGRNVFILCLGALSRDLASRR